jgi:hypothetical protein
MIQRAVAPFLGRWPISIAVLAQHDQLYQAAAQVRNALGSDVRLVVLPQLTRGPADTAAAMIRELQLTGPVLIKDCDNWGQFGPIEEQNAVWTGNLAHYPNLTNTAAKSYLAVNSQDIIVNIVEKAVISNHFVAGAYQFTQCEQLATQYDQLAQEFKGEIFLSHVIARMINKGRVFVNRSMVNWIDVGTAADWQHYNSGQLP